MSTVREFSPAGPCLTLCEYVSETAARLTYRDRDETVPGHVWAGIKNHATPPIRRPAWLLVIIHTPAAPEARPWRR